MLSRVAAFFGMCSRHTAHLAGHPLTFIAAFILILGWAASGPWFGWSDSHSLFINTATTIVTFLMVFLLQASSNRDAAAVQAKLDLIMASMPQIPNTLIAAERRPEGEIEACRPIAETTRQ